MIRRYVTPAVTLAALTLAGCGNSTATGSTDAPDTTSASTASGTSSQRPSPTSHPSSTKPTSTSSGTAAGAPGVPEPARQHTTKGAIAFAKYYIKKINETGMRPKHGVLEPLALKTCGTCRNLAGNIDSLIKKNQHNSAPAGKVRSSTRFTEESSMVIELIVDQLKIDVLNADGSVARRIPELRNIGFVYFLKWTSSGWRISSLKHDVGRS